MWECQLHELQNRALDKDSFSRCADHYEPLTGFSLREATVVCQYYGLLHGHVG